MNVLRLLEHKMLHKRPKLFLRELTVLFIGRPVDGNVPSAAAGIFALWAETAEEPCIRRLRPCLLGVTLTVGFLRRLSLYREDVGI